MRETTNPVFRSLAKQRGGYAQFGGGAAGAAQFGYQGYQQGRPGYGQDPYAEAQQYRPAQVSRPLTIDDVVTKTGITLGVLSVVAVASYAIVSANVGLAGLFAMVGAFGGLGVVFYAMFSRKQDNKALVLTYAALEGLFLGSISFLIAGYASANAGVMIGNAILGTFGVFIGMLVVYKTGAIRVTPKFTRMIIAGIFGVLGLMIVNLVMQMLHVGGGDGLGLRGGGKLAIGFSLLCIAIAAFSFLIDFDAADQLIRAGAPERAAWGIALGLTITLVWLYIEILQLLSYFQSD